MRTYPDKPVDFDQAFELAEQHPMAPELRKQIAAWIEPHTVNTRTDHSDAMLCVDIAYALIVAYIAERERTVRDDPELAAQVREGIAQAERGETVDLGSFAQHLDESDDDE